MARRHPRLKPVTWLTPHQAITMVVNRDHAEAHLADPHTDRWIQTALRRGIATGCRTPDGHLLFIPTHLHPQHLSRNN